MTLPHCGSCRTPCEKVAYAWEEKWICQLCMDKKMTAERVEKES